MATPKQSDNTFSEEASAFGERAKGAVKEGWGNLTGNESLRREGDAENARGNARQERNDVLNETPGQSSWLTGTFRDRNSAESAYSSLTSRGYSKDDINVMMSDDTRQKYFAGDDSELGNKAMEGAGVGSAIGGVTGGVLGAILALGTNAVFPGLGLVVAGPLLAGLAGAGAGGLTGGVIGALVGSGIPEDRAKVYDEDIRNGGIVMGVRPRSADDASYFENEWRTNYKGENVYR